MTLEAQVRHLVTYRDPAEGTLIYTVFTKKCQKRCKKGIPPVFDRKIDGVTYQGCGGPRGPFCAPISATRWGAKTTSGRVLACTPP